MKRTEIIFGIMILVFMAVCLIGIGYFIGHAHGVCYALKNVSAIPVDEHLALVDIPHDMMAYFK